MGAQTVALEKLAGLDALVLAVPHAAYLAEGAAGISARVREGGVLVDVRSALERESLLPGRSYWSL
jgi:UDP-N-acetyl-D-galactosamine dehydrogenase